MSIRIVPPSGSDDSDGASTDDSGPARLGRKSNIDHNDELDTSDYPYVDIHVNTDLEETIELQREAFTVYEEGNQTSIEAFDFRASSLDLVFVFDDTASMGDAIAGAKRGITKLTNAVADRSIDAQYGLVSFKDDVEVDQPLTSDPDQIKQQIEQLEDYGGGDAPEANFDAIEEALELNLREDAETVFVDITDSISHYRNDGSGYSDYLMDEVAEDLNEAGVTFVAIAPDIEEGHFGISDNDVRNGSLKRLAGEVGGLWTDINEEDFDWVLDRIIALLVGTYIITIHTCTPPGERRSVTVEFDHDRFESDTDTAWMSIPVSETLPPECAEGEGDLKPAGASGIDTRTERVSDRDELGVEEGSSDEDTSADDSESESVPLAIETSETSVSPGDTVEITVRDPDGRVGDARITGAGVDQQTSDRGIASVTLETEGEIELEATGPRSEHAQASTMIEVRGNSSDGLSEREAKLSDRTGDKRISGSAHSSAEDSADSGDATPVRILPESDSMTPGESVRFTVRSHSGDRVEGATLITDRGQSAVTDSRGTCEFVFEDAGEVRVTVSEVEGGNYEEASVSVNVE
jgi:plastocyanin